MINAFKMWLIDLLIEYQICSHRGKFKKGDILTYNWKAKNSIPSVIGDSPQQVKRTDNKTFIEFTNGDTCDAFWVRKLYWWEKLKHKDFYDKGIV